MRYKASKRVRVMTGLMWFMFGVASAIVLACVLMTIKVNNDLKSLGL